MPGSASRTAVRSLRAPRESFVSSGRISIAQRYIRPGPGPAGAATAGPCRSAGQPFSRSAAVVGGPVGLAALRHRVVEHPVLLRDAGVPEVAGRTAVRGPGRRAELIQAVVPA